ncbi:hypothetical protein QZH41_019468 [Actinostola sp. cb2023]|nr:hypothetical protein QZH41_019468 [Actinostola sp. cb2023]
MYRIVLVEAKWKCSNCGIHYKAIGCYKDDSRRPLPEQILNERDTTSIVYGGRLINWHDWDNYIEGFACRCAELAQKKGYSVFGLQFYGECWSGASLASSKAVGAATGSYDCIGPQYKPCSQFSRHCVGSQFKNFIYQIVPDCNLKLDGLGCYADRHQKGARPLPLYFLTDRDASLDISSKIIDWRNWDVYMPELACRCANKAKELGHNTFGLQYYGECWTGSKADFTYNKDGLSNQCIDKCYEPCQPYEKYCAGKQFTNYVYRLADAACEMKTTPLGCYKEVKSARALGTLLADEGNPANPIFTGNMLNVRKWGSEFPQFLCRCARAAKNRGFSVFGVDNKGKESVRLITNNQPSKTLCKLTLTD